MSNNEFEKEEIMIKLKLFETCLMTALTYGMEAWPCGNVKPGKMRQTGKLMLESKREQEMWPSEQKIQYATVMITEKSNK